MTVFPQLVTGAAALYPVVKRTVQRTVVNALADGSRVVLPDTDAATLEWELRATGLTRTESDAIQTLFDAVGGRWKTFTFLDPAGNLLSHSEEFAASGWSNGALIQLTPNIADPFGTTRATTVVNAGQAVEAVAQVLAVPGNFQYCLSVWVRSAAGSSMALVVSTAGGSASKTFAAGASWVRVSYPASLGLNTSAVTFGVALDAGASVDLFGMQVEAQPAASDYKRTGTAGGVRSNARFAADQIQVTAQGTDVYDAVIRVVSAEN